MEKHFWAIEVPTGKMQKFATVSSQICIMRYVQRNLLLSTLVCFCSICGPCCSLHDFSGDVRIKFAISLLHRGKQRQYWLRLRDESHLPEINNHRIPLFMPFLKQDIVRLQVIMKNTDAVDVIECLYNVLQDI